jgi:hypothetical protein
MKKLFTPLFAFLLAITATISFSSCSSSKLGRYVLTEQDAAAAIRQLLEIGAKDGAAFTKDGVMNALFPESMRKTLNTLQQLGLTSEIDRFTTTLATASEKTAERSIPVFVNAITGMRLSDAMSLIKKGGSSATDYLRSAAGTQLREAIKPVMKEALDEYKLTEQWNKIIKPAQALAGNKLNFDLANLMAGMVSESMFQKMEEKEKEIRANAAARTTPLLQKVFSRDWN